VNEAIETIKLFRHYSSMTPLDKLHKIARKPSRLVIGAMSGTSMDAISVVLCKITGHGLPSRNGKGAQIKLLKFHDEQYPHEVRNKILGLSKIGVRDVSELNVLIAESFARASLTLLKLAGTKPGSVDLIGSHGQTIYHHSGVRAGKNKALRSTLQIGDGDTIAERTGITTVSDFRARDIAARGEGAPLTPYADAALFSGGTNGKLRIVLNLGGVANVTVLHSDSKQIIGFDTGPANGPLDRLVRILSKGKFEYDIDGRRAQEGKVSARLLAQLLKNDSYLKRPPPKSTGFEMYGDEFVTKMINLNKGADNDLLATLTEFSAVTVIDSIRRFISKDLSKIEVIVAGGGAFNKYFMERLKKLIVPGAIVYAEDLGVPAQAREAMAFALFANDLICGDCVALPNITGVSEPTFLGKISLGRS